MSNDKAEILTEAEVEREALSIQELDKKFGGEIKVDCFVIWQTKALSTIRQMAGLLEEVTTIECEQRLCGVVSGYECESCTLATKAEALLARYKGERTS